MYSVSDMVYGPRLTDTLLHKRQNTKKKHSAYIHKCVLDDALTNVFGVFMIASGRACVRTTLQGRLLAWDVCAWPVVLMMMMMTMSNAMMTSRAHTTARI